MKIPAEVFDAMKEQAQKHGGVGCGQTFLYESYFPFTKMMPFCARGLAIAADAEKQGVAVGWDASSEITLALDAAGFDGPTFDWQMRQAGIPELTRVPWDRFVEISGIERGE